MQQVIRIAKSVAHEKRALRTLMFIKSDTRTYLSIVVMQLLKCYVLFVCENLKNYKLDEHDFLMNLQHGWDRNYDWAKAT